MRWYEYKMEADDLHAPDDLKARLLAMADTLPEEEKNRPMMPAPESAAPQPVPQSSPNKKKKLIHFPLKQVGALAACLAVCVVGYGALSTNSVASLLWAKSSNVSEATASSSAPAMTRAAVNTAGGAEAAAYDYSTDTLSFGSDAGTAVLSADDAAAAEGSRSTDNAKIIYTASLTLESKDYDAARTALDAALTEADGYLDSSSEYTDSTDSSRSLSLTLRVPQDNYKSFLEAAASVGSVTYENQQAEDVTTQYMDVEARLSNLEAQRTRLQELQAQATSLSDLIEIESSLSDVQSQIESWQSQLNWYSNQVECCTVYITLNEVQTYSPTSENFLARLTSAFGNGWTAFVGALQQALVSLVYAWPVVVLAVAAVTAFLFHRKNKKKKQ